MHAPLASSGQRNFEITPKSLHASLVRCLTRAIAMLTTTPIRQRCFLYFAITTLTIGIAQSGWAQSVRDNIDTTASEEAQITLTIMDVDGSPVDACQVRFYGRVGNQRIDQMQSSSSAGTVAFRYPRASIQFLRIETSKDGFVPTFYSWDNRQKEIELPDDLEISLAPGHEIHGQVVNEAGQPIAEAQVNLSMPVTWPKSDSYYFNLANLETDAQGNWSYANAPKDASLVRVRAEHEDYQNAFGRGSAGGNRLVLQQGLSQSGLVVDPRGKPIPGAIARLGPDRWGTDEPQARTDESGRFVLKNCEPGENVVTVQAVGFAPQIQQVTISENEEPLRFQLSASSKLKVRIVDQQGQPIENATFVVDGWQGYRTLEFRETSNKDGEVVWESAPKDALICDILKSGYMANRNLPLVPGDDVQTVTLYPELVISGRVIDKVAEKPVESFRIIRGQNQTNLRETYWRTDEKHLYEGGKYAFRIDEPMQSWMLQVVAEGYRPQVSREFRSTEGDVRYHFLLEPIDQMRGRVIDATGSPVEGAHLMVASAQNPVRFRNGHLDIRQSSSEPVLSDAEGNFAVSPPDNEFYLLLAVHDKGFAELSQPKMATSLTVQLQPWATLSGQVKLQDKADAGREISYFAERPRDGRSYRTVEYEYTTSTDEQGQFTLERVIPGKGSVSRVVVVQNGQYTTHSPGWQTPVDLQPGEVKQVAIGGRGTTIHGKLVLDRQPPADTSWRFESSIALNSFDQETGSLLQPFHRVVGEVQPSGEFSISDVQPGDYQLRMEVQAIGAQNRIAGTLGRLVEVIKVEEGVRDLGQIIVPLDETLEPGDILPRFVAETPQGAIVDSRKLHGSLVFISFWSTYSDASLGETAQLQSISQEFSADQRVLFISLSTEEQIEAAWEELNERSWNQTSNNWVHAYAGPRYAKLPKSFFVKKLPANFLIGPDGIVIDKDLAADQIAAKIRSSLSNLNFEVEMQVNNTALALQQFLPAPDEPAAVPVAVLVMDDADPLYDPKDEAHDNLIALNAAGDELWRIAELESTGGMAGSQRMAVDPVRGVIYVAENVAKRLSCFDWNGRRIWQITDVDAECLAIDEKTGNIWLSGGDTIAHGETIVVNPQGHEVFRLPYRGIDILYHPTTEQMWLVGKSLIIVDRNGTRVHREPVSGHSLSSLAVDPKSGLVWIGERDHPDVAQSKNRLWLVTPDGTVKMKLDLGEKAPFAVACTQSGQALVGGYQTGLLKVSVTGEIEQLIAAVETDGASNDRELESRSGYP
ncbi:MAG: carboxypeptidase regulatory-like domain-containing protein, partial [bacterium]|nr:carboxypeptidase regulatory-like domain-containing protein [bacterium]